MPESRREYAALSPPDRPGRRRFLHQFGLLLGAGATAGLPVARAAVAGARSLSFVHTHTGETLTTTYWRAGRYQPDSLIAVNQLLRDFRTNQVHVIDPPLLDILFDLQTLSACDAPFEVISGYRSPQTNDMLRRSSEGVAQHSLHLQGRAIDVRLPGIATGALAGLARRMARGGVGFYAASDFVHVDTGRVRFW